MTRGARPPRRHRALAAGDATGHDRACFALTGLEGGWYRMR
jgi:hypothetical protein